MLGRLVLEMNTTNLSAVLSYKGSPVNGIASITVFIRLSLGMLGFNAQIIRHIPDSAFYLVEATADIWKISWRVWVETSK